MPSQKRHGVFLPSSAEVMFGNALVSSHSKRVSPSLSCIMNARWIWWPRRASSESVEEKLRRAPEWRIEKRIFISVASELVDRGRLLAIEEPESRDQRRRGEHQ